MITAERLMIKRINHDGDGQLAKLLADPTIQQGAHLLFSGPQPSSFEVDFLLQTGHFYAIYEQRCPGKIVGLLFTQPSELAGEGAVELGYFLAPACRGRGIMTEAVRGLTAQSTKLIVALTDKDNLASQRVLRRAGFQLVKQEDDQVLWEKVPCSHE